MMRLMVLRMIAAGSLSAFNVGVTPNAGVVRPPSGAPLQAVRTTPTPQPPPAGLDSGGGDKSGAAAGGRILPRGSLLNLSV